MEPIHGTTILAVRRKGKLAVAGDGQVTLNDTVLKHRAVKVRKIYHDKIIVGFAGATADALNLFDRFEAKLGIRMPEQKKTFSLKWYYAAAAVVLAFGLGTVWYQIRLENYKADQLGLSDVSYELASMEHYFTDEIARRMAQVDMNSPEVERYLNDLEKLEKEYDMLVGVLNEQFSNERVIAAMIQNYKLRLQILENLQHHLQLKEKYEQNTIPNEEA